jgi:hypothetical protein
MEVEEHLVGAVEGGEGWALAAVGEGEGSGGEKTESLLWEKEMGDGGEKTEALLWEKERGGGEKTEALPRSDS